MFPREWHLLILAGAFILAWTSILFSMTSVESKASSSLEQHIKSSFTQPLKSKSPEQAKLKVPTPIIVVGYPKSGTTSVWRAFTCAGIVSQHFCCCGDTSDHPPCTKITMARCILENMARNRSMLEGCGNYEVFTQIDGERPVSVNSQGQKGVLMEDGSWKIYAHNTFNERQMMMRHFLPQHFYLERLHKEEPNATYILPLRDSIAWANSAFNWFQMRGRIINEYMAFNSSIERPGKARALRFLARVYDEHTHYIRDFVRKYQSHALFEFNITDPNAGNMLSKAIGIPEECWGHHNKIGKRARYGNITRS